MKFNFNVDKDFSKGIERLRNILSFEYGDGITVSAKQGEKLGVTLKDGSATVYYTKKHLFFRQLGILVHNAKTKAEFELFEDTFFEEMTIMLDTACGGVPTVKTLEKFLDYSVLMGYGIGMIYIEDGMELENYPYFGHLRGRYTKEELTAVDDYAYDYGIEMIPCIECYGHLAQYNLWSEANKIMDTESVLLAREPKTYEFIDELIRTASECVRSKRIHIGMDEAWDMGRGKFMDRHGYVPAYELFTEVMNEIIKIVNKYGLSPMLWSDMYFRNANINGDYYDTESELSKEVIDAIPENVQLVYWQYNGGYEIDCKMLKKHKEMGREVMFAAGAQGWIGHFPENHLALYGAQTSLEACRTEGITKVMQTVWSNDGNECELFANLIGMSFFAELCFDKYANDKKLADRFFAVTGENYDAFMLMSNYHNHFEDLDFDTPSKTPRFYGKSLFWQDILEGLYDYALSVRPMSEHYKSSAEQMRKFSGGEFKYLIDFSVKTFDYLAVKTEIAEKLVPAYKSGDKQTLEKITTVLLPRLYELTRDLHDFHARMWQNVYKPTGWITLDLRYGGVETRVQTAIKTLEDYLSGKTDSVPLLELPRLERRLYHRYSRISNAYVN